MKKENKIKINKEDIFLTSWDIGNFWDNPEVIAVIKRIKERKTKNGNKR